LRQLKQDGMAVLLEPLMAVDLSVAPQFSHVTLNDLTDRRRASIGQVMMRGDDDNQQHPTSIEAQVCHLLIFDLRFSRHRTYRSVFHSNVSNFNFSSCLV
jgi:translation elongation factor EF-G